MTQTQAIRAKTLAVAALLTTTLASPASAQTDCYQSSPTFEDGSYTLSCPLTNDTWAFDPDGRSGGPWGPARNAGTFYRVTQ